MCPFFKSKMHVFVIKDELILAVILGLGYFDERVMVERTHQVNHFLYDLTLLRGVIGKAFNN